MLHNDHLVSQKPLAPVVVDEELADAIGAAISESLGEIERALERKFEQRLRDLEHKFELSAAKAEAKLEAFVNQVPARGSRGRR
jgi:hypothetical protein